MTPGEIKAFLAETEPGSRDYPSRDAQMTLSEAIEMLKKRWPTKSVFVLEEIQWTFLGIGLDGHSVGSVFSVSLLPWGGAACQTWKGKTISAAIASIGIEGIKQQSDRDITLDQGEAVFE